MNNGDIATENRVKFSIGQALLSKAQIHVVEIKLSERKTTPTYEIEKRLGVSKMFRGDSRLNKHGEDPNSKKNTYLLKSNKIESILAESSKLNLDFVHDLDSNHCRRLFNEKWENVINIGMWEWTQLLVNEQANKGRRSIIKPGDYNYLLYADAVAEGNRRKSKLSPGYPKGPKAKRPSELTLSMLTPSEDSDDLPSEHNTRKDWKRKLTEILGLQVGSDRPSEEGTYYTRSRIYTDKDMGYSPSMPKGSNKPLKKKILYDGR